MAQKIVIVDYGMGNLHSVYRKIALNGAIAIVSDNPAEIAKADKILLPGVGHFAKAMHNLQQAGIADQLNESVLAKRIPVLGICLGMQLFARESEEGNVRGLGWIDAKVKKFDVRERLTYKVPHMGWNSAAPVKESSLLRGIPENSEYYFLHSFHFANTEGAAILTQTDYEYTFVSAVEKKNIYGVQFHPEKSHEAGNQLLANFIRI